MMGYDARLNALERRLARTATRPRACPHCGGPVPGHILTVLVDADTGLPWNLPCPRCGQLRDREGRSLAVVRPEGPLTQKHILL